MSVFRAKRPKKPAKALYRDAVARSVAAIRQAADERDFEKVASLERDLYIEALTAIAFNAYDGTAADIACEALHANLDCPRY
jgi:hypothetical protein